MIQIIPVTLRSFPTTLIADYANVPSIAVSPDSGASGLVQLGTKIPDPTFSADPEHPEITAPDVFSPYSGFGATVALTSEQYAQWGTDDSVAIDFLLANYGLTKV